MIVILILLSVLAARDVNGGPPRFPNVGYLGSTYDLFKANPHSTKGLDPGFTLRNMFHYTYSNHTTADGQYSVPDGVNAVMSSACSFSFTSEITQGTSSYKNSLEVEVSADFKGWGGSFSASADYKTVHEGSSSTQTVYVTSQAKCEAYAATVQRAILNPALVSAISYLPASSTDLTPYKDFYDHWGTHFASKLRMGGRYGVRSAFSASEYTTMSSSGIDVKVSAGYSGLTSINVNAATSVQKEQASQFESHRKDYQIYQVGGKPPLDETVSQFEWAQTVQSNPLPLTYDMMPVTQIMTSQYFPDDADIEEKRQSLEDAVVSYCVDLGLQDESLCHVDQASENVIKAHFLSTFRKSDCATISKPVFVVPVVDSTYLYILGTMLDHGGTNTSFIVVEDSPLLADATNWMNWCNGSLCALRPECPAGFSSISDFICCNPSSVSNCLTTIPRAKPCIADSCLTQCSWYAFNEVQFMDHSVTIGNFGNPQFGHPSIYKMPAFLRYKSLPEDMEDQTLAKCLSFDCLQYE